MRESEFDQTMYTLVLDAVPLSLSLSLHNRPFLSCPKLAKSSAFARSVRERVRPSSKRGQE